MTDGDDESGASDDGSDSTDATPSDATPPDATPESPSTDAPLSDLARRVGRRRSERRAASGERDGRGDDAAATGDGDDGSLFQSMGVESVDSETLWAGLVEDEDGTLGVGVGDAVESVDDGLPGHDDHVVPKAEFCQQCPHFADPPEFACTREGSEIVEVVESDRFRVRNCPMVEED